MRPGARRDTHVVRPCDLRVLALLQAGEGRLMHDDLLVRWGGRSHVTVKQSVCRLRKDGWCIERLGHCGYRLLMGRG